jgi:DNA segregation ATPase FtsK/SpoIIIE, S-DNA-T family
MLRILKKGTEKQKSLLAYEFPLNESKLNQLLESPLLEEGVYSLEFVNGNSVLITPSLYRDKDSIEVPYFPKFRVSHYRITLDKPSFLPLYFSESSSLVKQIAAIDESVHVQLLFQKLKDNHKKQFIEQYKSYLEGNDLPFSSSLIRSFQTNAIKVLSKVTRYNTKRDYIPEIEQKILEKGYKFEIKVAISYEKTDIFEEKLQKITKNMDFYNELSFEQIDYQENMRQREFSSWANGQILCESELKCMLLGDYKPEVKSLIQDSIEESLCEVIGEKSFIQLVSLLPIDKQKPRDENLEIAREIPGALKVSKIIKDQKIKVNEVEVGATVQRITINIPKGTVFSDIKKKQSDVAAVLGVDISVIQGKEPNTVTFIIPCKEREIIYLKELLQNPSFIEFAENNPLPFICGIDMFNQPVYKCLTNAPHLLISGATNSGKSVFLNALLITLILLKKPSELLIYLIDPKKVELSQYRGFSHVKNVETDMEKAVFLLNGLIDEMERRYDLMEKKGVKKITAYNSVSKKKLPYIICAIDEYNDLFMTHPVVEQMVERLGQKARASGIHLIVCTQRPDKNVISGVLKTNLPSRIAFKLDNHNEYKTVFGSGIPYNLLGFGDGVVKYVGQHDEFIRFQSPVITLNEKLEMEIYENLKKGISGEEVEGIEIKEIVQEEPIEQLKRIIAGSGETRVAHLQKEMGIRINDVSELMKCLVDEGWLEKEDGKKGYSIIASDEEVDKWR